MRLVFAAGILLLGAGYIAVTGWYPSVAWLQGTFMRLAWPVVAAIAGLVLLVLGARLRRWDPFLSGWAALALAGCLLLVPLLPARLQQEAIDTFRDEEISDLNEAVRTEWRRRQQERAEVAEETREAPVRDRFTRYAGRIAPDSLAAIRELDRRMQEAVEKHANAYRTALDENPTRGPNAWITFRTLEELESERAAHQKLYAATRAFTRFIESFEETYSTAIEELGLKPPADRVAIAEMERVLQMWERNQTYRLRELDEAILSAALRALNVLHDEWGSWSYSPRDDLLSFENPDAERRFQEAIRTLGLAIEAAEEASSEAQPRERG